MAQTRGSHVATDQDCRADVPAFSSEFCQIVLGLLQLCVVTEQNRISNRYVSSFSSMGQFHFIKQLAVVHSIKSTLFVEKINEQCASVISKNVARTFSAERQVLVFATLCLPA